MANAAGKGRSWTTLLGSLAATTAGAALVVALPRFVGVSWSAVGASLAAVPLLTLAGLVALWFAGLLVHVPVLTVAMPGLSRRQALTLNLAGSSVSNVLPVGGPAGMGLGFAMTRSWGFRADQFTSYTVLTNLWNGLGKFTAGLAVLAVAAFLDVGLPPGLATVVLSAAVFVTVAAALAAVTFRTEASTRAVGRRLDALVDRVRPTRAGRQAGTTWLLNSRRELQGVLRGGWKRMSAGVLMYLALQAALLAACLGAVGAGAPWGVVVVAFAIERLISLAPITPCASGVAELGTVAALNSFGVSPVAAAAGVLLYRILMFAVEIPVGGALALNWMRTTRRHAAAAGTAASSGASHDSPLHEPVLALTSGAQR
jgi:uncharacterized membrane protein YbhN (UPF0104 family)